MVVETGKRLESRAAELQAVVVRLAYKKLKKPICSRRFLDSISRELLKVELVVRAGTEQTGPLDFRLRCIRFQVRHGYLLEAEVRVSGLRMRPTQAVAVAVSAETALLVQEQRY